MITKENVQAIAELELELLDTKLREVQDSDEKAYKKLSTIWNFIASIKSHPEALVGYFDLCFPEVDPPFDIANLTDKTSRVQDKNLFEVVWFFSHILTTFIKKNDINDLPIGLTLIKNRIKNREFSFGELARPGNQRFEIAVVCSDIALQKSLGALFELAQNPEFFGLQSAIETTNLDDTKSLDNLIKDIRKVEHVPEEAKRLTLIDFLAQNQWFKPGKHAFLEQCFQALLDMANDPSLNEQHLSLACATMQTQVFAESDNIALLNFFKHFPDYGKHLNQFLMLAKHMALPIELFEPMLSPAHIDKITQMFSHLFDLADDSLKNKVVSFVTEMVQSHFGVLNLKNTTLIFDKFADAITSMNEQELESLPFAKAPEDVLIAIMKPENTIGSGDDEVEDNNPLHKAVLYADLEALKSLENHERFKNWLTEKASNNTPLILALKLADFEAAEFIISKMQEAGLDVNDAGDYGMTALHWACFFRQQNLVDQLLEAGAHEMPNSSGRTPSDLIEAQVNLPNLSRNEIIVQDRIALHDFPELTDLLFHFGKIALNLNWLESPQMYNLAISALPPQSSSHFRYFYQTFKNDLLEYRDLQPEFSIVENTTQIKEEPLNPRL